MEIDDPGEVMILMIQLEAELPFRVGVSKELMQLFRREKFAIPSRPLVTDIVYMDDEAGIVCRLEDPDNPDEEAAGYFASITQLMLPRKLNCYRYAARYQKRRIKRLRRSGGYAIGLNSRRV